MVPNALIQECNVNKLPSNMTIAKLLAIVNDQLPNDTNRIHTTRFFNELGIELFEGVKSKTEMMQKLNELKEEFITQKNQLINQLSRIQTTKEITINMHSFTAVLLKLTALQHNIVMSLAKFIDYSLGVKTVYDPLDHHISFDELCKLVKVNKFNIRFFEEQYTKLLNDISETPHIRSNNLIIPKIITELAKITSHSTHQALKIKLKQCTIHYFKRFLRKKTLSNFNAKKFSEALKEIYNILVLLNNNTYEPSELINKIKQKLDTIHHLTYETTKDFFKRLFTFQPNYFSWVKSFNKIIHQHELHIFKYSRDNHFTIKI